MADKLWALGPPGEQAVELDRDVPRPLVPNRARERTGKGLRCSFCQAELGEDLALTTPGFGVDGQRRSTSSFCSTHCRDCVLALAALHPSPLASSEFVARRALLTDRLLDLWRRGQGPDPALVLQAAEAAGCGLVSADAA